MVYFTTFFDKNYLSRGIVLYESLKANCLDFRLHVLCLDEETFNYFQTNRDIYPDIISVKLQELEDADPDLRQAKSNRSKIEYYFTLSPCLPLYILKKFGLLHICSLDADIMFFSSVDPIFDLLKNFSIIITPHKFSKELLEDRRDRYGKFNVSFQIFKNDVIGLSCLEDWRSKCINWCYDIYDETDGGRFADQKYLDTWHRDYPGQVHSLEESSNGLAVWNIDNYEFSLHDRLVCADGTPVIFFHFHNFKILKDNIALNGFDEYKVRKDSPVINQHIYLAYWEHLCRSSLSLASGSDLSIRQNLSVVIWKQLIVSGTFFLKVYGRIFNINLVTLRKTIFSLKERYGAFTRP